MLNRKLLAVIRNSELSAHARWLLVVFADLADVDGMVERLRAIDLLKMLGMSQTSFRLAVNELREEGWLRVRGTRHPNNPAMRGANEYLIHPELFGEFLEGIGRDGRALLQERTREVDAYIEQTVLFGELNLKEGDIVSPHDDDYGVIE